MELREIASLTGQMLDSAKNGDFDALALFEARQGDALAQHFSGLDVGSVSAEDRRLLSSILTDTNELIAICECHKQESEAELRNLQASKKAVLEYGANDATLTE